MTLTRETIFVVTGAAGGITSAIVTDLAVASKGIFYLLDLVDAPPATDPYIVLFRQGGEALKQALIEARARPANDPRPSRSTNASWRLSAEAARARLKRLKQPVVRPTTSAST